MTGRRLPVRIAVHYLGCAVQTPAGIAVPSAVGPLIECLADVVDRVTIVAYDPPPSPGLEDLTEYCVSRHDIGFLSLGPKGTWREYREHKRRVAEIVSAASSDWDVLLLRMVNRRAALVSRANRCPRIATILGGHTPTVIRASRLPLGRKAISLVAAHVAERHLRRILKVSGVVFVNSDWLADRYRPVAPHLVTMPTSVRRGRFSYRAPDRFDGGGPNVLVCGRISADKGVYEALDAFADLRAEFPSAQLHFVGTGDAVAGLRERGVQLGVGDALTFHGWVPAGEQLFSLYEQMDVLLCLSPAESLPRTVWEALAHSVLVVTTPVGGLPGTFDHEEEVLFVSPGSPNEAADAVRRLVRDRELRTHLIHNGWVRSKETDLEHIVQQITERIARRWPELQPTR